VTRSSRSRYRIGGAERAENGTTSTRLPGACTGLLRIGEKAGRKVSQCASGNGSGKAHAEEQREDARGRRIKEEGRSKKETGRRAESLSRRNASRERNDAGEGGKEIKRERREEARRDEMKEADRVSSRQPYSRLNTRREREPLGGTKD